MNLIEYARAERCELLDLLESLTPQEWRTPSLCEGWTVHDVVAHLLSYDELSFPQLSARFARGWFQTDRINALGLAEYRERSSEELVDLLRHHLRPQGFPAMLAGAPGLADAMSHQQDIRRPLGRPRTIPAERLIPALRITLFAPILRGILRTWDVRLVATDIDWSFGRGPEVRGTGEALLMAAGGRRVGDDELSGPGAERLQRRIR